MRRYAVRSHGRGYGQGYGPGSGRSWCHDWTGQVNIPEGYDYLGPCRCGFGPNAFWQDKETGRIFRAFPGHAGRFKPGYSWTGRQPSEEDLKAELDWLRQEKEDLEKKIQELEESLKEKTSKTQGK